MNESRLVDVGSAQSLYQQPPSRFTATFVGNANLLPVVVDRCDDTRQQAWVRLGSRTLEVTSLAAAAGGEARTLCVRPHALALEAQPGGNALEATVLEVQWRGSAHRLYCEAEGHELWADCKPLRSPPARGDRVTLHFAPGDATLIAAAPPGTSRRDGAPA
jgi:2-aminoethylphosphonate transport system ATP-binding protein